MNQDQIINLIDRIGLAYKFGARQVQWHQIRFLGIDSEHSLNLGFSNPKQTFIADFVFKADTKEANIENCNEFVKRFGGESRTQKTPFVRLEIPFIKENDLVRAILAYWSMSMTRSNHRERTNPDWTKDELILALELFFREPSARGSATHPGCIELSKILNALQIHDYNGHGGTFRNPNGVGMKLSNFLRYDPNYHGKGLQRGSKLEEEVWNTYAGNQNRLKEVAAAIRAGQLELESTKTSVHNLVEEDEEAEEGKLLIALHKRRERNASFARKKKENVLRASGSLSCEVCGFDFQAKYGLLGQGFAECHHEVPISNLAHKGKTKMSDLRVVCANCHRMLHRGRPWPTIESLRAILSSEKPNQVLS